MPLGIGIGTIGRIAAATKTPRFDQTRPSAVFDTLLPSTAITPPANSPPVNTPDPDDHNTWLDSIGRFGSS